MHLGIEIGGTKLQLGVGPGDGSEFVAFERRNVDLSRGGEGIREQIREVGRSLIDQHDVHRIGIGFGGPVFGDKGIVQKSHQVSGWDNFPLVNWCEQELGKPTRLGNDCDCAALAEAKFGAGRGKRTVFYVTVGTGIGGGLVIDGKVHGTDRPAAAEIGHLRPLGTKPDDITIPAQLALVVPMHLSTGDVESFASGPAIANSFRLSLPFIREMGCNENELRDLLHRSKGTWERLTVKELSEAASCGNQLAKIAFVRPTETLGWAISQMITLIAPDVVIIGGGVSLVGEELFFKPVRAAVEKYVFEQLRGATEIVPAQLGESVVVHGALALAGAPS